MRRATKAGAVLETIIILAGLALVIKGSMAGASTFKLLGTAQHTDGTIDAIFDHGFGANIEFKTDQGVAVVFSQAGPFLNHGIAERIPVVFDPADPPRAMVDKASMLWFTPLVLAAAGFLVLVFGFRLRGVRNL